MAEIEMQDPLSTEIQSSTIAGTIEALNRVSKALNLNHEFIEKATMYPVSGLEPEDPRRIYQVDNGNRLWLSSPEPKIYINGSEISSTSNNFSIDYIGGSITFEGTFRPSDSDSVSVSCDHISSTQFFGGSEVVIAFSEEFYGQPFFVSGGYDESYSGVVDSSLKAFIRVNATNTIYTITAKSQDGESYSTEVEIGPYYGQYEVSLSSFSATIAVGIAADAELPQSTFTATASLGDYTVTKQLAFNGSDAYSIELPVSKQGLYNVFLTYNGVYSGNINSMSKIKNANINSSELESIAAFYEWDFYFIAVIAPEGSTVKASKGDIEITLQPDDAASMEGVYSFFAPSAGEWTVTATLGSDTASKTVNITGYGSQEVTLSFIPETLEECTWAQIHEMSAAGTLGDYYDVGDTKDIKLNGTVGSLSLSNLNVSTFILGINHNPSREGNNKTHFALGKIGGNMVALCDGQYNSSASSGYFVMNGNGSNSGGWNASEMRKNTLGNSGTPSSPPANSLLAALPAELRAVLKPVTKYTDNTGNGGNSSGAVTATTDYLWLMAEFEVFGSRSYANQYEKNSQMQYDYFKAGNSKVAYKHNSTSSAVWVWLRSSYYYISDSVCALWSDGSPTSNRAYRSGGVLAGFAV